MAVACTGARLECPDAGDQVLLYLSVFSGISEVPHECAKIGLREQLLKSHLAYWRPCFTRYMGLFIYMRLSWIIVWFSSQYNHKNSKIEASEILDLVQKAL
jgi:hypothetical protein